MGRTVEVLLVEDSPADARLTIDALKQGSTPKRITVVRDGAEALNYLHKRGDFVRVPRPDLVLLDLNLPKRDGLEVLREVKSDPWLRSITIIVLTTSQYEKDIQSAYELAANCYIVKPLDLDQFLAVMQAIEDFWMNLASLPTVGRDPLFFSTTSAAEGGPKPGEKDKTGSASATVGIQACAPRSKRRPLARPGRTTSRSGISARGLSR
jgi:CheY-like chemotaxis protein